MPARGTGSRQAARNSASAACVVQSMEDLIEDLIVCGFFQLALAVGDLLLEFVRDLRDVIRECSWPNAHAARARVARLRRWNERVQRSLGGPKDICFRI